MLKRLEIVAIMIPVAACATWLAYALWPLDRPAYPKTLENVLVGCPTQEDADELFRAYSTRRSRLDRAAREHHDCVVAYPGDVIIVEKTTLLGRLRFRRRGDGIAYWSQTAVP